MKKSGEKAMAYKRKWEKEATPKKREITAPSPVERVRERNEGPYKGFLYLVCEDCGKVRAFCVKKETYSFRCECGWITPLENLRPMFMHCKCGQTFRYKTNAETSTITHSCIECGAPVDLELNGRETAYVTIGVRKDGRR